MENLRAVGNVYNSILGNGANSMMFQNVREKAGLAYSAKSVFYKQKKNIFIKCGIQIENYQKAVDLIKVQLENIKKGEFSEEDINNSKKYLISGIKNVEEEQDTEIVYYIGQEISKTNLSLEEYINNINKVMNEDNLDPMTLYQYGLYVNSIAGTMKNIERKEITKAYNGLPIHSKSDIAITSNQIMELLKRGPGEYLKEIYCDLESKILYHRLVNEEKTILEYIRKRYQ